MKVDIWMPIYINDYLADTMRLDAEKHGIYLLLMMDYWKHGFIPIDMIELALIARVAIGSESLKYIVDNFFTKEDQKYTHKRIDQELKAANSRRESAKNNGRKGGRPRKDSKPTENLQGNPQKTNRFNEGIPTPKPDDNLRGNLRGNPQKTSSPSPNKYLKGIYLGDKEESKFSPYVSQPFNPASSHLGEEPDKPNANDFDVEKESAWK